MKEIFKEQQACPSMHQSQFEKKWVAVYTRSRYEKKLADDLADKGITAYVPLMKTLRQWSDRKRWVDVPLFHSYVFVCTELFNHRNVLDTPGAVYIVRFEGKPAIIPDTQIEGLKALLGSSTPFEVTNLDFESGERVEITHGPMLGQQGIFLDYKGRKRVMIRIDAVGQSLIIDLSPAKLRKLNPEEQALTI